MLCASIFLSLVLVDSRYAFLPSEGVFNDQHLAAQLLERLEREGQSFWQAFVAGTLPTVHPARPGWHGAFLSYLYLPFHYVFGASWTLARYWCLFVELAALGFLYGFMRRVYGRGAALLTLFFLTIHPGYVMTMRTGAAFFSPMHLFSCGSLYFASLWWSTRRHLFFGVSLALIALGLSTMLWFGWFVAGLAVAAILLGPRTFVRLRLRDWWSSLRFLAAGISGALFGAVLLIYREWTGAFEVVGKISSDTSTGLGVYLANIPVAWATLCDTWWAFSANAWFGYNSSANGLYPWAVVGAIVVVAVLALRDSQNQPRLLLPVVLAVILAQVPLALRSIETATFFIYPLPQMVLAAAITEAARKMVGGRAKLVVLSLALLLMGAELRSLSASVSLLRDRIEAGATLNPVYRLADWLDRERTESPLFLHRGDRLAPYLYFLQPELGVDLLSLSTEELVQRFDSAAVGGVDWMFVYGVPGPRPEILSRESQEPRKVEIVAEFSNDRFHEQFPIVVLGREDSEPQYHFGPPVTVYRLRK